MFAKQLRQESRSQFGASVLSYLMPVHGGGAEVREAVSLPQSAVSSETIAVVGPGGDLRVAPSLVCAAGQPRQQQEAQIVEVDRLAPDRGFYRSGLSRFDPE